MNIPADLSWDNPWAVWGFFILFIVIPLIAAIYRQRKQFQRYFNLELILPHAPSLFWGKGIALVAAWCFAILALMGPKGNGHYPEEGQTPRKKEQLSGIGKRKAHDVVLAVDASASMGVKDGRNGITRLEYAKQIGDQLISKLQGDSVALYAFTYEPELLSPATLDTLYVRLILRWLKINEGDTAGTSLTNLLAAFQKKFLARPGQKIITLVILSDGEDNQLKNVDELKKEIQGPSLAQTQIYTIGIGTEGGGQVPELAVQSHLTPSPLQLIASVGHGKYFQANDYTAISLVDALLEEMNKVNPVYEAGEIPASFLEGKDNLIYDLYFQIPLALSLLCLAFYLFGPNTWRRLSLVLLFFQFTSYGIDQQSAEQAAQNIEASLYAQGADLYRNLLNQPLKQWEQGILTYNWGSGLLLGGNPKDAEEIFERAPLSENPFPLLLRNLRANRALAFYQMALQEPLSDLSSYEQALYELSEAHTFVRLAQDADCRVIQLEGGKECPSAEDLTVLEGRVVLKRALLFKHYLKERIAQMPVQERLPLLFAELQQIKRELDFLKEKPDYRPFIQSNLEGWRPIWEKLPSDSRVKTLFEDLSLKIERGSQVEAILAELEKALTQEMEILFQGDQKTVKRTTLQGLYQFALLQDPPLQTTLEALQKLEGPDNNYLKAAIEAQTRGDGELTKFYLLAAQAPNADLGDDPKAILKEAILLQQNALRLNRFLKRIPGTVDPAWQEIAKTAQQKAIEESQSFLAAVYNTQEDRFNDLTLPLDKRCQADPWNEVIALYGKGREHAIKGLTLSLNEQGQALSYWKEAIKSLDKEGSGKGCPSGGGAASQEIKNIQEMDQDDRIEKKTSAVKVEGVNPW